MYALIRLGRSLLRCERGTTATEYSVMIAALLLGLFVVVGNLGDSVSDSFNGLQQSLSAPSGGGPDTGGKSGGPGGDAGDEDAAPGGSGGDLANDDSGDGGHLT